MNEELIGKAAGLIWSQLRDKGPEGVSLTSLKKTRGIKADVAVAALGWLAREGKLRFGNDKTKITVFLAESELGEVFRVS